MEAYEYLLNMIMQVSQLKPEIAGILDAETFIREFGDKSGAPLKLLFDQKEYADILQQQAQAAEEEKQLAQITTAPQRSMTLPMLQGMFKKWQQMVVTQQ